MTTTKEVNMNTNTPSHDCTKQDNQHLHDIATQYSWVQTIHFNVPSLPNVSSIE